MINFNAAQRILPRTDCPLNHVRLSSFIRDVSQNLTAAGVRQALANYPELEPFFNQVVRSRNPFNMLQHELSSNEFTVDLLDSLVDILTEILR